MTGCRAWWATAPLEGAIGILHLDGDARSVLASMGIELPEVGSTRLAGIADIDEVIIARPSERSVLVMPHGGQRIRQLLTEAIRDNGARLTGAHELDPRTAWPEAGDEIEACMLDALARTESPRAVDLLLAQPEAHRQAAEGGTRSDAADEELDMILMRLIDPPLVAIVGRPNVGKSTLLNRLADRRVAIAADVAGTTRDSVVARLEIDGVACDVVDLPGLREDADPLEQQAIALSDAYLREADCIVGLVEPANEQLPRLERTPDLIACNKSDTGSSTMPMRICALDGSGIDEFAVALRRLLVPDAALQDMQRPWKFHAALR